MYNLLKACELLQINEYSYEKSLSGGKASTTLLYESKNHDKIVIKMLIAPRNEDEKEAFKNEAKILKELAKIPITCFSPRILIDYTEVKDYPIHYFGIELCYGVSLSDMISKEPLPWKWDKCIEIVNRIASALSGCSTRYIHRDLHPGNILVRDDFEIDSKYLNYVDPGVTILDYGCSKDQLSYLYYGTLNENKFRHIGAISSWSPEFIMNPEAVDQSHDSWAIGVILYYLLTGNYPYEAKSFGQLYNNYLNQTENFSNFEEKIPLAARILVKNLLSISPKQRFLCGEICSTCSAILYTDLIELNNQDLYDFYKGRGGLYLCIYCKSRIGRAGSRCYSCGKMLDTDDFIPVLKNLIDK